MTSSFLQGKASSIAERVAVAVGLGILIAAGFLIATKGPLIFYFVLGVLGLVFFWIRVSPAQGLTLLCILSPFAFTYTLFSGVSPKATPTVIRLARDALVLVILIGLVMRVAIRRLNLHSDNHATPIVFLAYYVVVRSVPSLVVYPFAAVYTSLRYWALYPVLALLIPTCLQTMPQIQSLVKWLLRIGVLVATIGLADTILMGFGHTYVRGSVWFAGQFWPRAIATLGNPNNLAGFMALLIIIQLVLIARRGADSRSGWSILRTLLYFSCLLATFSRGTWLILLFMALVLLVNRRSTALRRLRPFALTMILIVPFALFAVSGARNLVQYGIASRIEFFLADARLRIWSSNISDLSDTGLMVLLGMGPGFTTASYGSEVLVSRSGLLSVPESGQVVTTDNGYLGLLVEIGLVGVITFVSVLIYYLRLGIRLYPDLPVDLQVPCLIGLAVIVFSMGRSFLSNYFATFPGSLYLWVFVGILLAVSRLSAGKNGVPTYSPSNHRSGESLDDDGQVAIQKVR